MQPSRFSFIVGLQNGPLELEPCTAINLVQAERAESFFNCEDQSDDPMSDLQLFRDQAGKYWVQGLPVFG